MLNLDANEGDREASVVQGHVLTLPKVTLSKRHQLEELVEEVVLVRVDIGSDIHVMLLRVQDCVRPCLGLRLFSQLGIVCFIDGLEDAGFALQECRVSHFF